MIKNYLKFCNYTAQACGAFAVGALILSILVIVELVFERYFFQRKQMLSLFNHFKTKYKFNSQICNKYEQRYYKTVLYLAGSYQKKDLGKEMFSKIESKKSCVRPQ